MFCLIHSLLFFLYSSMWGLKNKHLNLNFKISQGGGGREDVHIWPMDYYFLIKQSLLCVSVMMRMPPVS